MVASTIEDVRKALEADDKLAAGFGREFVARYAATAFGVLPKTEIDLLVFSLLIEAGIVDANGSIYRIARALNVTPAKARSLLFQHQLRHVSEAEIDHAVMIALTTARYRKEGDNLAFGVQSPLIYAAIRAKMQDGGVFADVSLSGDILRVNPEQFGAVISSLISHAQAERLIARLKKNGLDEKGLRKAVAELGTSLAKKAVEKGTEEGAGKVFETLGDLLSEHGGHVVDVLADFL